ncbi:MAG: hypothetical protein COU09_00695 [Candidatus Harrisonbacteria bacterium CG10_big_fil_rev_8_21_14_0_10_44_23]|uniref:Uncharacterized protein n=1 Tax=Candidatus Harrisonbacteria bacterium CG10_big_fil_rev_8_21_14_0_10_44_23 TaxID=1974585 RepID=A0A2H0USV3_9BACT|nr:MAG: hypothetical protein COU09_00695 [Candidatus Harrisonbacteria bacterium CG10_big_fil_rev_8_21_14_0_10_44_23]
MFDYFVFISIIGFIGLKEVEFGGMMPHQMKSTPSIISGWPPSALPAKKREMHLGSLASTMAQDTRTLEEIRRAAQSFNGSVRPARNEGTYPGH